MNEVALPMFPLGGVLFPHVHLPLRVFEPRYRRLVEDVLTPNGGPGHEFGVVLIERGGEVGGGDVRFDVGTVARIISAVPQVDGGWMLSTVGTRRIRVDQWLEDSPYPRAIVTDHPDADDPAPPTAGDLEGAIGVLRRVLAMRAELNLPGAPATVELADDPAIRLWHACAVAPVGPIDDLRLLSAPSARARLATLIELLDDEALVLAHRLSGG